MIMNNQLGNHTKASANLLPLPVAYQPTPWSVIVGKGTKPQQNMGNQRLRLLATSVLHNYQQGDKKCKTQIVSDIISTIRNACKDGKGAFVKFSKKDNRWYDLADNVAREKVTYVFRDLLADEYKSSSKSKVARRNQYLDNIYASVERQAEGLLAKLMKEDSNHNERSGSIASTNNQKSNRSMSSQSNTVCLEVTQGSRVSTEEFNAPETRFWSSTACFLKDHAEDSLPSAANLTALLCDEDDGFDAKYLMGLPLCDDNLENKEDSESLLSWAL